MLGRIGDAEAQRHAVQERRLWQRRAAGAEVVGDVEHQLVFAVDQLAALKQRSVAAAIGIGGERLEKRPASVLQDRKLDLHAGGGHAVGGIQNVRGKASHSQLAPSILSRRPRAMWPICSIALPASWSRSFVRRRSNSAITVAREA